MLISKLLAWFCQSKMLISKLLAWFVELIYGTLYISKLLPH